MLRSEIYIYIMLCFQPTCNWRTRRQQPNLINFTLLDGRLRAVLYCTWFCPRLTIFQLTKRNPLHSCQPWTRSHGAQNYPRYPHPPPVLIKNTDKGRSDIKNVIIPDSKQNTLSWSMVKKKKKPVLGKLFTWRSWIVQPPDTCDWSVIRPVKGFSHVSPCTLSDEISFDHHLHTHTCISCSYEVVHN